MIYTLTLNPSIDQYLTVKKLIPKDKLKAEGIFLEPGGKGFNVARVVRELRGKTKAFGVLGGHTGAMVKDLLAKDKIAHCFCSVNGETRTNLVINDRTSGMQTRINPPGPRLNAENVRGLSAMLEGAKPRPKYWALCGSIPPGVPENIYQKLIERFQQRGERCVLDADERPLRLGLMAKPFMIKPNKFELARLIGRPCVSRQDILKAGRSLTRYAEVVAITLAEKGAYIVTKDDAWHVIGPQVKVKSDIGAGDTFIGGFLTALDRGESLREASRLGIAAATSTVMNAGTARCQRLQTEHLKNKVALRVL